ncbi:hypothetical protein GUJ93_ZPchr0007g3240 [Zizania palustris]|uniref:Uncharacterized protein n=1 Tax=Zizania palustris TaxID=103762 RepID=A0A8J5TAH5_ZIZPA|nr:hypothetical protein GUJ93_ZPchr0007g3240 [Zizania palustris]
MLLRNCCKAAGLGRSTGESHSRLACSSCHTGGAHARKLTTVLKTRAVQKKLPNTAVEREQHWRLVQRAVLPTPSNAISCR